MKSNQHGNLIKPITIGNLTIPGNIFLAPLAGFTDRAYREIALHYGACFTYTEMVSAEALARNNIKTADLMKRSESEKLLGIQLFLPNPDTALRALPHVLTAGPSLIDINCGCPVPKITKTGCGAALMMNTNLLEQCVRALTDSTDIPITAKIRSGWDSNSINYLDAAKAAEQGGAAMLTLHPRTKKQGYSGKACWEHLKIVKETVNIPVIGSGDLYSAQDVQKMLSETNIDGVMIARGAIGNPFIFRQVSILLTENIIAPDSNVTTSTERITAAILHLETAWNYFGRHRASKEIRKHLCAYTKGILGAGRVRNLIVRAESIDEYKNLLLSLIE